MKKIKANIECRLSTPNPNPLPKGDASGANEGRVVRRCMPLWLGIEFRLESLLESQKFRVRVLPPLGDC